MAHLVTKERADHRIDVGAGAGRCQQGIHLPIELVQQFAAEHPLNDNPTAGKQFCQNIFFASVQWQCL